MMVDDVRGRVVESSPRADFAQLYRDEHAGMVKLARLLVRSTALAEELVHDAFIIVYRRLDELDRPGAYLRQVVVNNCRGSIRRSSVGQRKLQDRDDWSHLRLRPDPSSPLMAVMVLPTVVLLDETNTVTTTWRGFAETADRLDALDP